MAGAETVDQRVRALIRYVSVRSIPAITKFMGMMLLFYAGWFLFYYVTYGLNDDKLTVLIGIVIIVICGSLILLDFSFNVNRTIGLYAMAIGGNRAFKFMNYLTMDGGNEFITAVIFIFALVMIGVSVNLCYTGYIFLRGETRGRVSMIFSSSFMLVVTFVIEIVLTQTLNVTFIEVMATYPEYTVMIILYLVLICMLGTETVRRTCRDEHYLSILSGIRKTDASSEKAFIYRGTAKVLSEAFTKRDTWKKIDNGSPVEEEYSFVLYNRTDDISYVTVQKWKDSDELYFTISDHNSGSLINAYRFACTGIVPNGSEDTLDRLIIYGNNVQMQILVRDEPKRTRWGYHV